jgi:hypothetical protein
MTTPEHLLGDYPAQKFRQLAAALPADLTGKSVPDVGEMKRRGADHVVAIDSDPRYLEPHYTCPPCHPEELAAFCAAMARRYAR